jgi:hypothetical protein
MMANPMGLMPISFTLSPRKDEGLSSAKGLITACRYLGRDLGDERTKQRRNLLCASTTLALLSLCRWPDGGVGEIASAAFFCDKPAVHPAAPSDLVIAPGQPIFATPPGNLDPVTFAAFAELHFVVCLHTAYKPCRRARSATQCHKPVLRWLEWTETCGGSGIRREEQPADHGKDCCHQGEMGVRHSIVSFSIGFMVMRVDGLLQPHSPIRRELTQPLRTLTNSGSEGSGNTWPL